MSCYRCKYTRKQGMTSGGIYYTDIMEDRTLTLPELFRAVEEYTVVQYTTVERLNNIQEVKHEVYSALNVVTYDTQRKWFRR